MIACYYSTGTYTGWYVPNPYPWHVENDKMGQESDEFRQWGYSFYF